MRIMTALCCAIAIAPAASPARAFDCAAARGAVDRAICADPATKRADDAMNEAYERLRGRLSPEQAHALLLNQRRWLTSRMQSEAAGTAAEDCSDAKDKLSRCLRGMDEARTRILKAGPLDGPGLAHMPLPFFLEKPETGTTYDVGMFLYRYPNADGKGEEALNAAVDHMLSEAWIERDKEDVSSGRSTGKANDAFIYHAAAAINYASPRLLSMKVDFYTWSGGPHPDKDATTINIDMAAGRRLDFDDLVTKSGREAVLDSCFKQFNEDERNASEDDLEPADAELYEAREKKAVGGEDFDSGTAAIEASQLKDSISSLAHWTFSASGVEVALGRIRGFADGDFFCTLPTAALRPLAKPSFPLPP